MSCSARQNELKESPVTSMPGEYLFVLAFWGGKEGVLHAQMEHLCVPNGILQILYQGLCFEAWTLIN